MTKIEKIIKDNINATGSISLEEYMTVSLYHPVDGYYSKKNIIGKKGDFITAPEISQVFGELISSWLIYNASNFFKKNFNILELGPGKGVLMKDILRTMNYLNKKLFEKIDNIYFFEKSKKLMRLQKRIAKSKIILDINQIQKKETFILANEFFDAIPVNQYIKIGKNWHERRINTDHNNQLGFVISKYPVKKNIPFPVSNKDGLIFEYSHFVHSLLSDIFKKINKLGGVFIIIDYAKDNDNPESTLSGIHNHKLVSPFFSPGKTDLSIKPDFSYINSLAKLQDCKTLGPFTQRYFLKKLGIEERINQLIKNNLEHSKYLLSQKTRLIDKNYMGEIFKVLIITNKHNKDLIFDNA